MKRKYGVVRKWSILLGILSILLMGGCKATATSKCDTQVRDVEISDTQVSGTEFCDNESESTQVGNNQSGSAKDGKNQADDGKETSEKAQNQATLVMIGDVLIHDRVADSARQEDGTYDFTPLFANMKQELCDADLAIANQEVIIGGEELGVSGYPCFNAPYELGDALVDAGIDVVLHGTNHALDKGKAGIVNCCEFWKNHYPNEKVLGICENAEDAGEIPVVEVSGMRIAILNYTYGTNGIPLPGDMPYAVNLLEEERLKSDLAKAQELADFTVVCPHWGTEYTLEETAEQEKWAQLMADYGADLIIGTHPHVIEPIKEITRTNSIEGKSDTVPCYFSIGNYVNWTSDSGEGIRNRMVGGMAKITLIKENESVKIKEYEVEPLVSHVQEGIGNVTVYPLHSYTKELAEENAIIYQDSSFSLESCNELAEDVFGKYIKR